MKQNLFWEFLVKNPNSIKKKIAITYSARSGSYMLSGFLDSHPKLITSIYPIENTIYNLLAIEIFKTNHVETSFFKLKFLDKIDQILNVNFYNVPYIAKETKKLKFNKVKFIRIFKSILNKINSKNITFDLAINVIYISFGYTFNRPLNTYKPTIIIQKHVPFYEERLIKAFNNLENLSIIIMVRNPILAIDSIVYHSIFERKATTKHAQVLNHLFNEYRASLEPFIFNNYYKKVTFIKFEDLHSDIEICMRKISKILGIQYIAKMNEETLFGIKFFLNVKSGKVNGPSPERALITKTKIFEETDILFLQKKLRNIMLFFSYSPIFNFEPISNYKIFSKIKKNIFSKKYLYNICLYKIFPSKIFFVCQQKQNQIDKPSMVNFVKHFTGSNNLQKITSILEKISIFKIIFNYILLYIFTFQNYYKTNTLLNETEEIFKVFNNLKELKEEREILENKLKQLQK